MALRNKLHNVTAPIEITTVAQISPNGCFFFTIYVPCDLLYKVKHGISDIFRNKKSYSNEMLFLDLQKIANLFFLNACLTWRVFVS